jgi:hypothetical protein
MAAPEHTKLTVQTEHFTVLAPIPPFVDIILQHKPIHEHEFNHIAELAASYPGDPRLVEMVRKGGDCSAKVPYLMDSGETPDSILAALRRVAQPHIDHLHSLPGSVQATIQTLLSINKVPDGCEAYGIPALLEINRMQGQIIHTLKEMMVGRTLAADFHDHNHAALASLDKDWPYLRKDTAIHAWPNGKSFPIHATMQYEAVFHHHRMAYLFETCVIVDAPDVQELRRLTPPVLRRPLPEHTPAPATGSTDWLIRDVGKVGRHFTRALLKIIEDRLISERIALETHNYELINERAREALDEFIRNLP